MRSRKEQYEYYIKHLQQGSSDLVFQRIPDHVQHNYSYFPVVFQSEERLLEVFHHLQANDISPRRYFYPSLNALSFTKHLQGHTPVAESISKRILCLPQYHGLTRAEQDKVIEKVLHA
jgi:dTDP-4-amino-4,6-dideoxygalactose transaminase